MASDRPSGQSKISSFQGGDSLPWTATRRAVLALLKKGLSVAEIAKERNTSDRAVRMVRQWLINNHEWAATSAHLPKVGGVPSGGSTTAQEYRVHDFTLSLPVHRGSDSYFGACAHGNLPKRDGHYIHLYKRNVTIHGKRGFSFSGVDHDDALTQALEYWNNFVERLQVRYNVLLLKNDCVLQLTYETAETNNDLAEQEGKKKAWLRVHTSESGETWLLFDHSDSFEVDTVHKRSSGDDMQRVVAPVFNDYRDNVNYLRKPSDTWRMHDELLDAQLRLAGEIRELRGSVAEIASMQSAFFKMQSDYVGVQKDILKLQMPKSISDDGLPDKEALDAVRKYTG